MCVTAVQPRQRLPSSGWKSSAGASSFSLFSLSLRQCTDAKRPRSVAVLSATGAPLPREWCWRQHCAAASGDGKLSAEASKRPKRLFVGEVSGETFIRERFQCRHSFHALSRGQIFQLTKFSPPMRFVKPANVSSPLVRLRQHHHFSLSLVLSYSVSDRAAARSRRAKINH